jgi:hypothetical protein
VLEEVFEEHTQPELKLFNQMKETLALLCKVFSFRFLFSFRSYLSPFGGVFVVAAGFEILFCCDVPIKKPASRFKIFFAGCRWKRKDLSPQPCCIHPSFGGIPPPVGQTALYKRVQALPSV